jgi:hypothetical protein
MRAIAKEVMARAYRQFDGKGGHAALLEAIRPYVRNKAYRETASTAWARGRVIPPADVLLAAALVANVKIDELLFGESIAETVEQLRGRQDVIESSLKAILTRLDDLASQ